MAGIAKVVEGVYVDKINRYLDCDEELCLDDLEGLDSQTSMSSIRANLVGFQRLPARESDRSRVWKSDRIQGGCPGITGRLEPLGIPWVRDPRNGLGCNDFRFFRL